MIMKIPAINNILQTISRSGPQLGIAFSGGGARGFSHIGVVLALEKFGIKASIVSGVSAGAIAAALYGAGLNGASMRECFKEHLRISDFRDWIVPRDGLMGLHKFEKMLQEWLPVSKLEEMSIPTVICATDLARGKSIGFTSGEIGKAVIASCSIPVLFSPVRINGNYYVDGGVLRNLPAWAIRKNCDILVGSNCSPLDRNFKHKRSLISVALRSYQLMMKANVLQDLELCDFIIQNQNLSQYSTFSVAAMDKIILEGYDAASPVIEKLLRQYY